MRAVAAQDARLPQKVSATTPISSMQGVDRGSKGCSSSHDMLGITSVPAGPEAAWRAAINPQAALHRFDLREGAVDEQHAARLNTEGVELGDQVRLRMGLLWHEGIISQTPPEIEIAVGAKRPPLPQPLEKGNLTASSRGGCLRGAAEMTWQVRRLISAPVEPSRWRDSGQQPLATGAPQGVQNPQAVVGQRPASAPSRRLISICQRSPKASLAIATYWPSGERDWMFSFENTWLSPLARSRR